MSTIAYRQEVAPAGGYQRFRWARAPLPKPPNGFLWFGAYVAWSFAALHVFLWFKKRRQRAFVDAMENRIAIEPLIEAEHDRMLLRTMRRNRDLENELTRDVPGWQTGTLWGEPIYENDMGRWFAPSAPEMYSFSNNKELPLRTMVHLLV